MKTTSSETNRVALKRRVQDSLKENSHKIIRSDGWLTDKHIIAMVIYYSLRLRYLHLPWVTFALDAIIVTDWLAEVSLTFEVWLGGPRVKKNLILIIFNLKSSKFVVVRQVEIFFVKIIIFIRFVLFEFFASKNK